MDAKEVDQTHKDLLQLAILSKSRLLHAAAASLDLLARENAELRDRVWALDRANHTHDPLEGEDG